MQQEIRQLHALKKDSFNMRLAAESWISDFQILISTILSARTRDEVTIPVAKALFKKYHNAKSLAQVRINDIEKIIKPINFYKTKAKNIINCSKQLVDNYNGKIPHDFEKLVTLRGVGRKTANVFLSEVGKDAIGVDTHLSYVSRKLNWSKNTNPHKIEKDLQKLFPKKYWKKLNSIVVRFGKTHTSRKKKDKLLEEIRRVE
ncbi:endonuclease III [Candidatus Pacearchaeota archaeon CG10_big_fil_rev_8_21_14_0_10_34_12]|nr:MAG: endonuclease III [Candidatus Pacearchaeota archaeon CG10_big_fil_rev_8_21_14_0_10_34_12]